MRAGIECKISLAKKLPITLGGLRTLSFDLGTFANASPRNLLAKNPTTGLYEMTGPFGANVLATKNISGDIYGQFESQKTTKNTYSEALDSWAKLRSSVTENITTSPLGDSTANLLKEDSTPASNHQIYQAITPDGSSAYFYGVFAKKKERSKLRLRIATGSGFPGDPYGDFNIDSGAVIADNDVAESGIWALTDDWFLCYIGATSNAAVSTNFRIYLLDAAGATDYDGDGSSGEYLWGVNVVKADYLTSYIKAIASPVTKAKDVFYWANATLPAWLKGSTNKAFSFNFIPNHSSVQHAAKGTDTFLFSVDGTENVECYIAGADQKLYIDVDSVNKFTSASAFAWDMHDTPKVTIIPNNGSNCRVITSGFNSGNADETGTIISMQDDGDLYWAMRHTTDDLQLDGLQSEPRTEIV